MLRSENPHDLSNVLEKFLRDPATSWSVGTFGAMAEFFHDAQTEINSTSYTLSAHNSLGAIQIDTNEALRLIPYEGLSKLEGAWTQGVLVCMPVELATMENRTGLYELNSKNTNAQIFDLGLGIEHLDVCIHTNNLNLISVLRAHIGSNVFEPKLHLVEVIQAVSPTRVFRSKAASIHVYSAIPAAGDETPLGPHTHLSEKLLSHNQTQAATVPVPDNWVPVLAFFPPNPIRDGTGTVREFDMQAFVQFQDLLVRFGPEPLSQIKSTFIQAMETNTGPDDYLAPESKAERTALRVAIRQRHHSHGSTVLLDEWKAAYEATWQQ